MSFRDSVTDLTFSKKKKMKVADHEIKACILKSHHSHFITGRKFWLMRDTSAFLSRCICVYRKTTILPNNHDEQSGTVYTILLQVCYEILNKI